MATKKSVVDNKFGRLPGRTSKTNDLLDRIRVENNPTRKRRQIRGNGSVHSLRSQVGEEKGGGEIKTETTPSETFLVTVIV